MVEKVSKEDKSHKVAKVPKSKLDSNTKVSEENKSRIIKLKGYLENSTGKHKTENDAITYLFDNLPKEKSP